MARYGNTPKPVMSKDKPRRRAGENEFIELTFSEKYFAQATAVPIVLFQYKAKRESGVTRQAFRKNPLYSKVIFCKLFDPLDYDLLTVLINKCMEGKRGYWLIGLLAYWLIGLSGYSFS